MDDQATIGEAVARTVKSLRSGHGWSLDQLAGRSGVSKGVLVALEQGRGNPSLGTLVRISEALGVPLTRLVQVEEEPPVRLFPPDRQVVLWRGDAGGVGTLLGGSEARPSVELWNWTLEPGEIHESQHHTPGTREIAYVVEGVLTLKVDSRPYTVETGSTAVFAGDRPHGYCNEGDVLCRIILAVLDI